MRFLGSKVRILLSKSNARGLTWAKKMSMLELAHLLWQLLIHLYDCFGSCFISYSDGAPISRKMKFSVWVVVSPGNRGFRRSSSPNMHPTDHISIALVYGCVWSSTSGDRYHNVYTWSVIWTAFTQSPARSVLARPKSAILSSQFLLTRILRGFRSRCSTRALCIYLSPRSI